MLATTQTMEVFGDTHHGSPPGMREMQTVERQSEKINKQKQ